MHPTPPCLSALTTCGPQRVAVRVLTALGCCAGIGIQVTDGSQVLIQGNVIEGEAGPGIVASAINGLDIRSNVTAPLRKLLIAPCCLSASSGLE